MEKTNSAFEFTSIIIKSIKSKYIINNIFSYIYKNKKLELIKYNKKYQKIFKIDINYYKEISGKLQKVKEMEKLMNMMMSIDYYLKVNIKMEKNMEKEKNIIIMVT